jgi:hypothetical protein
VPLVADRSTASEAPPKASLNLGLARVVLVALAVIGAAAMWQHQNGGAAGAATSPAAVTEAELQELSDELGRPVFWLGPPSGRTLELSRTPGGRVFLRYLPAKAQLGGGETRHPTVATYPVANAYAVTVSGAQRSGGIVSALPGGAALITYLSRPRSAYYVERGAGVQVEVYDPRPGRAAARVRNGELRAVPSAASISSRPNAATIGALEALPAAVGHPVYWAGAQAGVTYELTRTSAGGIFVRYLPGATAVGDTQASYLTIATYPGMAAFQTVKADAEAAGARIQTLPQGRLLIRPRERPRSAYLVSPRDNVQVEVYAPEPGRAAALVASGAIVQLAGRN